jgi:hypothetical protein
MHRQEAARPMNAIDALVYIAILVFVVVPLVVAFVALARIRNADEAARLGEALWPDPAKTAGGKVGKRWDTYARSTDGWGETYTGGCGDQLYPDHHTLEGVTDAEWDGLYHALGLPPEPDHHTIEEYEAIAASEQGEEIVREEHLP